MQTGQRLGAYEIVRQLGAGGMGEVWLAQDTRLGREVAIKVLPDEFAADAERLARFEQEARAAAALNHPNIAAVFDVGVHDGTHFMVQEYLRGEPLRELLQEGAMPLRRALGLGAEIAEALRAAHRAGIVHRDLKPENVFVTTEGHAKVLDFGLAKLVEGPARSVSASLSPTVLGTAAGVVMGTAGYMAPEQIRGADVDGRADLFALGCVLQEMLTGRRAFDGDDVHEMLYRIQRDEPAPLRDEAGPLPARVAAIVGKTLRKDAEDRYQCAGDLLVDLRGLLREADAGTLGEVESTTVARAAPASPLRLAAAAAVLLAAGLAAGWLSRVPEAAAPGPVVRLRRILPTEAGDLSYRISSTYNRVLAMAPDGGRFAVVSNRLRLGTLDEIDEMQSLAEGTIRSPAFSPDGTWVAYWKGEALWRVPATGGSELVIAEMTDRPFGLQWGEDGFLYVGRGADGVWRANVGGGDELTQVFVPEPGEFAHGPQLLPGGEWLLMTLAASRTGWESAQIVAVSMRSGERRVLVQPGRDARYVATGHLLWVRDGGLFANRFDPASLQVRGDPWPMATPIRTSTDAETGAAYFAASDTGAFAYIDSPFLGDLRPVWDDGSGELIDSGLPPRTYDEVNLSPDDRLVAATIRSFRGVSVWVYSIGGRGGQDLTPDANSRFPAWSPDGAWVYFASDQEGDFDIWRRRADLSAPAERVYVAEGQQYPGSISADGKQLAFVEDKTGTNPDIYLLELDSIEGDPVVTPVVTDASADTFPIFSQDDRFLAYQSDEGGELTISILEIATGRRWRAGPGYGPRWRGPYLYYLSNGAEPGVQQARVELSPTVSIAEPELFSLRARGATGSRGYDAASDGRILLLYSDAANAADSVIVVLNWPQEMAAANAAR